MPAAGVAIASFSKNPSIAAYYIDLIPMYYYFYVVILNFSAHSLYVEKIEASATLGKVKTDS